MQLWALFPLVLLDGVLTLLVLVLFPNKDDLHTIHYVLLYYSSNYTVLHYYYYLLQLPLILTFFLTLTYSAKNKQQIIAYGQILSFYWF